MSSSIKPTEITYDRLVLKRQRLTLIAMCLALGMAALDDTVVNVALPSLQTSLSMSVSGLQWILNAYLLSIACLVLPAGSLGDVYGRRKVFLAGLSSFVMASMLVGIATSGQMAIVGRLLQGVGAAALLPSSLAILSDAYPNPKERTKAIGIWSGVAGLALIVGPALGGGLVDTLGWRSIFYLNIPLGVLTYWLTLQSVPLTSMIRSYRRSSSGAGLPQQLDLPGMLLSVVTLASFIVLLMGFDGVTVRSLLLLFLSVGSAIAFIIIESASARPILPLKLFCNKSFSAAFATNALLMFMLVSLLFMFSLFLQQVQGYSATAAGLRFLPLIAAFILASILSGYASAVLGWRWSITAGFMIAGVAVLSLVSIQADTSYSTLLFRLILVGFGVGFTLSPLTAAGMSLSAKFSGIAAALMNTSTRLGGALGIAIQGGVLTARTGANLDTSLQGFDLDSSARQTIVAEAISHGATRPAVLMEQLPNTDALTLQQVEQLIYQAFVSGLRSSLWVGAIALFIGAVISAFCIGTESISTETVSTKTESKHIST